MPNKRTLLLHDLDSSVKLDSVNPPARSLTIIRDIESALFGFAHSITHANIYWIANNIERFLKLNPFKALLRGYFGDDVDQVLIDEAAGKILDMTVRLIQMRTEMPTIHHQSMWMALAGENLSPLCLQEIFKIYEKSSLNKMDPLPYGIGQFTAHWERFKRQSDDVYQRRVTEIMAQVKR